MRRLLILLAVFVLVAVACDGGTSEEGTSVDVTQGPTTSVLTPTTRAPTPTTTVPTPTTTVPTPTTTIPTPTTATTIATRLPLPTRDWTRAIVPTERDVTASSPLLPALVTPMVTDLAFALDGTIWTSSMLGATQLSADGALMQTFGSQDGLGSSDVRALEVAGDGTVWVGTNVGLASFDGSEWHNVRPAEGAVVVQDLDIDDEGTVWMASSEGLASFDGEEWLTYRTSALMIAGEGQTAVAAVGDEVFLKRGSRLHVLDPATLTGPLLPSTEVIDFAVTPDGTVWIEGGSTGGLYRFDTDRWDLVSDELRDEPFGLLTVDDDGHLWRGGIAFDPMRSMDDPDQLRFVTLEDGEWRQMADAPLREEWWGQELVIGPDHEPWLVGPYGVSHHADAAWHDLASAGDIPGRVESLAAAPDGTVWAIASGQAGFIADGRFNPVGEPMAPAWGAQLAVGPDGTPWLATGSRNLWVFDGTVWQAIPSAPINIDIFALTPDGAWVADCFCGGHEVSFFDGSKWRTYGSDAGLDAGNLTTMAAGPSGVVWTMGPAGLARFDGTTWTTYDDVSVPRAAMSGRRGGLAVDPDGVAWVVHSRGLTSFDGSTINTYTLDTALGSPQFVMTGSDGTVVAAFHRFGGTDVYQLRDGDLVQVGDTLPSLMPEAITQGSGGSLWLGTESGIWLVPGNPYVVQSGDTLGAIASAFRTTIADLLQANPYLDTADRDYGNLLRPGDVIEFPDPLG